MNPSARIMPPRWGNRLRALLREELAPSPTRWRATLRLCALCVAGTAFFTAFHVPGGHFMVLMFFLVAMSDAPTSRATVVPSMLGSLAGGAVGIVVVAAFADQPWILFPLQAVLIAGSMFLMRITTVPTAPLFFAVSFVIVAPEFLQTPVDTFYAGIRATLFQTIGIGLGTCAQLLWWPEDPAVLLMEDLTESLRSVEIHCRRLSSSEPSVPGDLVPVRSLRSSAARLFRQLDLLREAEAKDHWLRQRHTEQIKLITDLQLLVFAAQEVESDLKQRGTTTAVPDWLSTRMAILADECQRLGKAIAERRPPEPQAARQLATTGADPSLPALDEMERILAELPATLVFLGTMHEAGRVTPTREPVARRRFFTPASGQATGEALRFALKVALAASLCGVLYRALDWPGIGTCVMTTVLVAQATVGCGRHKAVLRFGGALLAGLAVLVVVEVFMPNMDSLASLLVVTGVLTFVAAWIATGSSRTAYLGVQMGVTLYLVLFPAPGPTLDLVPARDRLLGILLGIAVMAVIDAALWPVFTRSALRRKVAGLLRQMAGLPTRTEVADDAQAGLRSVNIHQGIAEALTLQEELIFETTSGDASAERERRGVMRALNRLQEVFLSLLAIRRENAVATKRSENGAASHLPDEQIANRLNALADVLEGEIRPPGTGLKVRPTAGASQTDGQRASLHRSRLYDSMVTLENDVLSAMEESPTAPSWTSAIPPRPATS